MSWQINPRLLRSEPLRRCGFPKCHAACCLYGVWVDVAERDRILSHAPRLSAFLPPEFQNPKGWFDVTIEPDTHTPTGKVTHTTVLGDSSHYGGSSCIFLRQDSKCVLQVAGEAISGDPWSLKPFYCILHPLDLDDEGRITLDETTLLVEEAASCLVSSAASIPLWVTFEPELRYFLGDEEYERIRTRIKG
jgi:hypothetical protein